MASWCFSGALNPFCRQPVCVSPCSDYVALATSSSGLYLYSHSNESLSFVTKFSPHTKALSCMSFHPTISGLLATGGAPNSRVTLWSIHDKTVQRRTGFSLQRRPNALVWLPDNEELIIGDEHGGIYHWNEQQKLSKFDHQLLSDRQYDEVHLLSVANKQKFIIAIGFKSGLVCIGHINLESNHLEILHKLQPDSINTICCSLIFTHSQSPDSRSTLFYVTYGHGCVKVCDYVNGKILGQLALVKQTKTPANDPRCKTYYPLVWLDSDTLLTGNLDGQLIKIDVRHSSHLEKSQLIVTPPATGGKPVFALAIQNDKTLFMYSFSRKLCLYDLKTLSLTTALVSMPGSVNSIQACSLQTSCIALGVDTGNIGVLDMSGGGSPSIVFLWQSIPADVCRLTWHPLREGRLAYSTRLGHVALHDTLTGRSRVVYDFRYKQQGSPTALLWGPLVPGFADDQSLAVLYSVGDGKLHRWDSPDRNCLPTDLTSLVNESNVPVLTVAFSDDRTFLSVLCSDGDLFIRSCPSLSFAQRISINCSSTLLVYHPRYLLSSVDPSPKQHWLASSDKHLIRLIDPSNPNVRDLAGHTADVECLAWSPSVDYLLASGSHDKTIRLWNVETGSLLSVYIEHSDVILSLLFSSNDPNLILSGSRDQSLHIWHIEKHTRLPDVQIPMSFVDEDEEETSSNSGNKPKRHNKPRPNRSEREKKKAAKVNAIENTTNGASSIMNELNFMACRLLWSMDNRPSDPSVLPDKASLVEKIKEQTLDLSDNLVCHLLYWSGEYTRLWNELLIRNILPSINLFWMAILNNSEESQPLLERTLDMMMESDEQQSLQVITMMIKAKRYQQLSNYLTKSDFYECSLLLDILLESDGQIHAHPSLSVSPPPEQET